MSQDTSNHNLQAIRELLLAAFTVEKLRRFCSYHSTFRPVVHEFGPSDGIATMVDKTIQYCEKHDLLGLLLWELTQAGVEPPATIESYLAKAQRFIKEEDYYRAIHTLRRAHRFYPHSEQLDKLLLEALFLQGIRSYVRDYDLAQAKRAFQEVLAIDPFYKNANKLLYEVESSVRVPSWHRMKLKVESTQRLRWFWPTIAGAVGVVTIVIVLVLVLGILRRDGEVPAPTATPLPVCQMVADFESGISINNLGGAMGAAFSEPDYLREEYTAVQIGGTAARLEYRIDSWAAFWLELRAADLRPYSRVVFDIRADPQPQIPGQIKLELKRDCRDQNGQTTCREREVAYASEINEDWQTMSISLDEFQQTEFPGNAGFSTLQGMQELVFTFEAPVSGSSGVVYLDNISFCP